MGGTPGVTGSPVTVAERREQRRQQARERITRNLEAVVRDFAYLVDRNESDRAKSAYLELRETTERALALVEEHNRRADLRERAMTMRPREDDQ
jgi:hypothetical protein